MKKTILQLIKEEVTDFARELYLEPRKADVVGSGGTKLVTIEDKSIELNVTVFYEKSFWLEFTAKGEDVDESETMIFGNFPNK